MIGKTLATNGEEITSAVVGNYLYIGNLLVMIGKLVIKNAGLDWL